MLGWTIIVVLMIIFTTIEIVRVKKDASRDTLLLCILGVLTIFVSMLYLLFPIVANEEITEREKQYNEIVYYLEYMEESELDTTFIDMYLYSQIEDYNNWLEQKIKHVNRFNIFTFYKGKLDDFEFIVIGI